MRLLVDVKGSELGHGQRLKCWKPMVCDAVTMGKHFDLTSAVRLYRDAVTPVRG